MKIFKDKWSYLLSVMFITDSIITSLLVSIGLAQEQNKPILWMMDIFNLSLNGAMILRLFLLAPFVIWVDKKKESGLTCFLYIGLYIILGLIYTISR